MRLPDFSKHDGFNGLRQQMGAGLISWKPDIDDILTSQGIDNIRLSEIVVSPRGLLTWNGREVVVYIRDQKLSRSSDPEKLCKFHVADCRTLLEKRQKQTYDERYVVATRSDGMFIVNFCGGYYGDEARGVECRLYVCKNCLTRLDYKSYRSEGQYEKNKIRNAFELGQFFEKYASGITRVPKETDTSALINGYTQNWGLISRRYREKMDWTCESCHTNLRNRRNLLDVHHINGQPNDNSDKNLRALCVGCHAEQSQHQHIVQTPKYKEYQQWMRSILADLPAD